MSNIVKETKVAAQQVAPDLNYKPIILLKPSYRFSKLIPVANGNSQVVTTNATRVIDWDIPANTPVNFSKSILSFIATSTAEPNNYYWAPADTVSYIQTIQLQTRTGIMLAEILNVPFYLKVMAKLGTPYREYADSDLMQRLAPNNSAITALPAVRHDGTPSNLNYLEPQYFVRSGLGAALVDKVQLELKALKGSLFEIDRELCFEDNLIFRVTMAAGSGAMFFNLSATDPSAASTANGRNITHSNLALYLCLDSDPAVLATLKHEIHSGGLKVLMPYPQNERRLIPAAVSQSMSVRVTKGTGSSLLKMIMAVFATPQANGLNNNLNLTWDMSNLGGAKVSSYYSTLQARRLQDFNVDPTDASGIYEDYLLHRRLVNNTCLQNRNVYQYNFSHQDDFSGLKNDDELRANIVTGLPLTEDLLYVFYATTPGAADYQFFNIILLQRTLVIAPGLVQVI